MALVYDQALFEHIRHNYAVKSADELVLGETYWSNTYWSSNPNARNAGFTLRCLLEKEHDWVGRGEEVDENLWYVEHGTKYRITNDKSKAFWFVLEYQDKDGTRLEMRSLRDTNIGESYNPWMVFDSEEGYIASKKLRVDVISDYDYDDYYHDDSPEDTSWNIAFKANASGKV